MIRGQRLLKAISNDSSDPQDTNTEHPTTSSRATNLTNNYQLPLPPKLSPSTPTRCQDVHQDLTRSSNSTAPTGSTSTQTQGEMSSQDSSADRGMHLGSSFGATEYHGITTYQWATLLLLVIIIVWLNQEKVPHCIRCKERHPPAPCTTASLRQWNEDLRQQERKFIRDQQHEHRLLMLKMDYHRCRGLRQVHDTNRKDMQRNGTRHWDRSVDRPCHDKEHYFQKNQG